MENEQKNVGESIELNILDSIELLKEYLDHIEDMPQMGKERVDMFLNQARELSALVEAVKDSLLEKEIPF